MASKKAGAEVPADTPFVGSEMMWDLLVERGKRINALCRSGAIGAERNELKNIAKGLAAVARRLATLEAAAPGRPYHEHLRAMESAQEDIALHAEKLPDPRRKTALSYIAEMYVMLRALETSVPISGYEQGDDVQRLAAVLSAAGMPLSIERVRGVLTTARNKLSNGITERQRWLAEDLVEEALGCLEPPQSLKS